MAGDSPKDDNSSESPDADSADALNPSQEDEELLEEAKARFELAKEAMAESHRLSREDARFVAGHQWDDKLAQDRQADGRPCLVINRLPQHIQQVTNDQRQNRPSIKVHPVDDVADPITAKKIQGLVRHIEYDSNADTAYDSAFEPAAEGGFGYFRIITQYADPLSFDQEIKIKRIRDPLSVLLDPASQEPDGSDANYGFVVDFLPKKDFLAQFPKSKLRERTEWELASSRAPDWVKSDGIQVVEYFYKDTRPETIVLLSTGETVFKKDLPKIQKVRAERGEVVDAVRERQALIPTVKWCKLNGNEILDKTDWPGKWIPLIPVYGKERYIDGKRILEGMVRHAKDPQRMLNYWESAKTEAIALAPRAPFIAAKGQIKGMEEDWKNANRRNIAVLEYNPVALGGQPAPPPQRQAFEPAVMAITQAALGAVDNIKATTGVYDASLGAGSPDTSGVAIQRRNNQSQTSNFHFIDNLTRSLKHAGRVIVDLIPYVYDSARTERIIGDDGEQEVVKFNQPTIDPKTQKPVLYDLSVGKYDVTIDVGPSFASKRQEAVSAMLDVARAYPQIMQVAGDLFVKNQDWPGAAEIADRIKKTLPPQLQDDGKGPGSQIPPQVKAQMQQMGQMVDKLTQELHGLIDERDRKLVEIESKERIAFAQIKSNETIELAKLDAKDAIALLNAEIAGTQHRLDLLHSQMELAANQDAQQQQLQLQAQAQAHSQSQDLAAQQSPAGAPGASGGDQGGQSPIGGGNPPSTPMEP